MEELFRTAPENVRVAEIGGADAAGFAEVTRRVLEEAAFALAEDEPRVVVVVREGHRSGADETEDLATAAEAGEPASARQRRPLQDDAARKRPEG